MRDRDEIEAAEGLACEYGCPHCVRARAGMSEMAARIHELEAERVTLDMVLVQAIAMCAVADGDVQAEYDALVEAILGTRLGREAMWP